MNACLRLRPKLASLLAGAALIGAVAFEAEAGTRAGLLQCNVGSSVGFIVTSNRSLSCVLKPRVGPPQYYTGSIRNIGLDVGFTGAGRIAWAVLTAGSALPQNALAGEFVGAQGSATFGGGVSANVLVGGNNRSISLQPLSVGVQSGVNLAAGVGALSLQPAAGPAGR
jgi:hypothetical protein